ncbi:MAG: glycosyl hydrolase family 8 [Polyangiaceae bacterium]
MTILRSLGRVALVFPPILCVLGCSSGSEASAGSRSPDVAGAGASSSSAGTASQNGDDGGAASIDGEGGSASQFGINDSAGSSVSHAGAVAVNPPPTWNSAKAETVTEEQLQLEYAAWKKAHVESCSNGSWVVVKGGSVPSEGIGYGMLLAVGMMDQSSFDGFWKYYQDHLDKNGLMNLTTGKCDAPGNNNSNAATDADLDTTMALVQAAARWPNGGYLTQAQALAAKVVSFESEMCSGRRVLRPGDAVGGCTDPNDQRINPSYFSPGYYKVFAHYFTDQALAWTALADGSYQLYAIYQARMGNLVPDWSGPDGSDNGSGYSEEACRTPWRVAVDYGWSGDTRAKTFMQNISGWVDANGGLPKAAQVQNSAFIGAFALSGGYEQGKFDSYLAGWLGAKMDDQPYYQGTLRVLYLLVAAGKFSSTL